jgi:hypothetical protein
MTRDMIIVDRFAVANAAFWLDQIASWLADPDHAEQLAGDLWPDVSDAGTPLTVIVSRAAAALRVLVNDSGLVP